MKKCSEKLEKILQDFDMPCYPDSVKESGIEYTDYLCTIGAISSDEKTEEKYVYTPQRNRQCSIGWHTECSLGKCGCVCHQIMKLIK